MEIKYHQVPDQQNGGFEYEGDSVPSPDSDSDSEFWPEEKILANRKLRVHQRRAYYDVLRAFEAESLSLSARRISLMGALMTELNIAFSDHSRLLDLINKDNYIQQIREELGQTQEQKSAEPAERSNKKPRKPRTVLRLEKQTPVSAGGQGRSNLGRAGNSIDAVSLTLQNGKSSADMEQDGGPGRSNLGREGNSADAVRPFLQNEKSSGGMEQAAGPGSLNPERVGGFSQFCENFRLKWHRTGWGTGQFQPKAREDLADAVGPGCSTLGRGRDSADAVGPFLQNGNFSAGISSGGGRGRSPKSLVHKKVHIRVPGEDRFKEFTIKMYSEQEGLHYLEGEDETMKDPLNWIDLREIPPEDIQWNDESSEISHQKFSRESVGTTLQGTCAILQNGKSSAGMEQAGVLGSSNVGQGGHVAEAARPVLQDGKSSSGISFSDGWGRSPESLVTKKVYIRMPGAENFKEFTIKMYDIQEGLHYLDDEDELEDPLNWIDLRQISPEDIRWNDESSEISHQKFSTESVGTILQGTHTILQNGKSNAGMEHAGVSGSSNLEQRGHVADAARPVLQNGTSSAGISFNGVWGRSPESLVHKKVHIRMPGEDFKEFTVKMYSKQEGLHYLEDEDEDSMTSIDLREIPSEDIQWNYKSSEISLRNFPREPVATILRRTSTYGRKRPSDILFKVPPLPSTANVIAEKPLNKACNGPEKGQGDSTESTGLWRFII